MDYIESSYVICYDLNLHGIGHIDPASLVESTAISVYLRLQPFYEVTVFHVISELLFLFENAKESSKKD